MSPMLILTLAHVLIALAMPVLLPGLVNRTKSLWAGRKGPGLLQPLWDLLRLLHKRPVYSAVTTPLFRAGPWVVLAGSVLAALIAPILGALAPLQFSHDFIFFAYTLGLARLFLMLSALDVGSSFEGMGAAREASFTSYIEPALFLLIGSALVAGGGSSFAELIGGLQRSDAFVWLAPPTVLVLLVLLQAEAARVPVDDPLTHLELTMIHEVMILDHSGPDFAYITYGAALKFMLLGSLLVHAALPHADFLGYPVIAIHLVALVLLAFIVGIIESTMARLRLNRVSLLLAGATVLSALAVLLVLYKKVA